jgi:hypothetical protein
MDKKKKYWIAILKQKKLFRMAIFIGKVKNDNINTILEKSLEHD